MEASDNFRRRYLEISESLMFELDSDACHFWNPFREFTMQRSRVDELNSSDKATKLPHRNSECGSRNFS
jgi:hypothetical protein